MTTTRNTDRERDVYEADSVLVGTVGVRDNDVPATRVPFLDLVTEPWGWKHDLGLEVGQEVGVRPRSPPRPYNPPS